MWYHEKEDHSPPPTGREEAGKKGNAPMKELHQKYVDNLAEARGLLRPKITPEMGMEEVLAAIHDQAERLYALHRENDAILDTLLFSRRAETLTQEEADDLSALADALFDYNGSVDTGIAYRIHQLLYDYALLREDLDLQIRELYYQGITLMYLNIRSTSNGSSLFVERIGDYFRRGAAYLDRYETLKDPRTRSFIIRCMGNEKYGLSSLHGSREGDRDYNMLAGWPAYMEIFDRTMAVITSPHYRAMDPEIPWDSFVYSMHYDRTQFLSALRGSDDPEVAAAVLESAQYVYDHQEKIASATEKTVGVRTRYVYAAARYHAGLIPVEELLEVMCRMTEEVAPGDFSGDAIWAAINAPEYVRYYIHQLPEGETGDFGPRLERILERQRDFLFRLPQNEYAIQAAKSVQTVAENAVRWDPAFHRQLLDYILACHPPTFVHSMVVADLARRFCRRLCEVAPQTLRGVLGMEDPAGRREDREALLERVYRNGLYHDMGKSMLLNYITQYSRRLLDEEFECVKLHTSFGCELLGALGMEDIAAVARGHHRFFDRRGGYPGAVEEKDPAYQPIVDIITVVDSLDAGTDNVGRSYAAAKDYATLVEELRAGRGTRYAPQVVALLDDPDFYRETEDFLRESRQRAYLAAYQQKKPD